MGTPKREPQEYSRNRIEPQEYSRSIIEYKDTGRYIPTIFLLHSWGSLFGVHSKVPLASHSAGVPLNGYIGVYRGTKVCRDI